MGSKDALVFGVLQRISVRRHNWHLALGAEAAAVSCRCRCGLSHQLEDEDVVQVLKSKTAGAALRKATRETLSLAYYPCGRSLSQAAGTIC